MYRTADLKQCDQDRLLGSFSTGSGVLFRDRQIQRSLAEAVSTLRRYLEAMVPQRSFPGFENLRASRKSFWVASRWGCQDFSLDEHFLTLLDGDDQGREDGLEALRDPAAATALCAIKARLDQALETSLQPLLGLVAEELPLAEITVRYRAVLYGSGRPGVSGIGIHPDGNLLSALFTNCRGIELISAHGVSRPEVDGVLVLPGSILWRWSSGQFLPTFHRVCIEQDMPAKLSLVGFLNFPDLKTIPRSYSACRPRVQAD